MKPHTTLALMAIAAAASLTGCQLKEDTMDFFKNESEVMILKGQNHDLNIENRLDRVSLYGSVDITRDQEGLAQALRLKGVVDSMVSALNEEQLNGVLPPKVTPAELCSVCSVHKKGSDRHNGYARNFDFKSSLIRPEKLFFCFFWKHHASLVIILD